MQYLFVLTSTFFCVFQVHPNSVYKCDLCKFVTTYPKSLEIHHAAKHTDDTELPFKCSLCTKGFARKQLLDMHLKRHKEEKE